MNRTGYDRISHRSGRTETDTARTIRVRAVARTGQRRPERTRYCPTHTTKSKALVVAIRLLPARKDGVGGYNHIPLPGRVRSPSMESNTAGGLESSERTETVSLREYAALEKELTGLKELIDIRADGDNPGLEDIWLAGQPVGKIIESNRKKADTAAKESGADASSARNSGGKDGENHHTEDDSTPLERIADDDHENPVGVRVGPSVTRAAAIMSNWDKWSSKAPKGRNIKDGLKTLIETVTGESLAWRQIYRACKKVEQLTKGKIVFSKHDRHGWMLIQPSSSVGG